MLTRIVHVTVTDDMLSVDLEDGRTIAPLLLPPPLLITPPHLRHVIRDVALVNIQPVVKRHPAALGVVDFA